MQDVAQLVRVLVCGAGGRGFEPHLPAKSLVEQTRLFLHPKSPLGSGLIFI